MNLYFWYVLVSSSGLVLCCGNRVKTVRDLLSCSGWLTVARTDRRLDIIDRHRRATDQSESPRLTVIDLLATPVTAGNVAEKIRVAHQFLSCSYAGVLMDLCDYERAMGPWCRTVEGASESFEWLEDYRRTIGYKQPLVSRMIGALSSLRDLLSSAETHRLETTVGTVLADFQQRYDRLKTAAAAVVVDYPTAEAQSRALEQQSRLMFRRLFAFYNRFCWPLPRLLIRGGCSGPTGDVTGFAKLSFNDNAYVVHKIKEQTVKIIRKSTETYEATSGFEYDPGSGTTRIAVTCDPSTVARVKKTNRLLANSYQWCSLMPLEIQEPGLPYRTTVRDLLSPAGGRSGFLVVTKENVHSKLKRAHQFLSCQFASVLIECCQHVAGMWTDCQQSQDSVCCWKKFLKILNEVDPSVVRMIDALRYFHELSPDTVYNRGIAVLLNRFKSSYDDRTALEDDLLSSWSEEIEKNVSEIAHASREFYGQFCYSPNGFDTYHTSVGEKASTVEGKGEIFKTRIFVLTHFYAVFEW